MKRIIKHDRRSVAGVRLYLDDYFELVRMLMRGPYHVDFRIEVDDYVLDDPKEIEEVKLKQQTAHELSISTSSASDEETGVLKIELKGNEASIVFPCPPDQGYSCALEVQEFLRKRRFWWGRLAAPVLKSALSAIAISTFIASSFRKHPLPPIESLIWFFGSIAPLFALFWISRPQWKEKGNAAALVLKNRAERNRFLDKDNRQRLVTGLIIAVVAFLLGNILGPAIKGLFHW